jgi:hypothetical protein
LSTCHGCAKLTFKKREMGNGKRETGTQNARELRKTWRDTPLKRVGWVIYHRIYKKIVEKFFIH